MTSIQHVGLAVLAVVSSGCAFKTIYEGRYDYDAGWQTGTVSQIASAESLHSPKHWVTDCRATEAPRSPQQLYALVEYHRHTSRWWRVVPVPHGSAPASGDLVHVNVERCDDAMKPRNGA